MAKYFLAIILSVFLTSRTIQFSSINDNSYHFLSGNFNPLDASINIQNPYSLGFLILGKQFNSTQLGHIYLGRMKSFKKMLFEAQLHYFRQIRLANEDEIYSKLGAAMAIYLPLDATFDLKIATGTLSFNFNALSQNIFYSINVIFKTFFTIEWPLSIGYLDNNDFKTAEIGVVYLF